MLYLTKLMIIQVSEGSLELKSTQDKTKQASTYLHEDLFIDIKNLDVEEEKPNVEDDSSSSSASTDLSNEEESPATKISHEESSLARYDVSPSVHDNSESDLNKRMKINQTLKH